MIFTLSLLGHMDHPIAVALVPVNAAGSGSRCLRPANLQQRSRAGPGIVAIGVAAGNDPVMDILFPRQPRLPLLSPHLTPKAPWNGQVAAALKPRLIPT